MKAGHIERLSFTLFPFFELQEVPHFPESWHSDALERGLMEAFRKWLLRETLSHYNIICPRSCWETRPSYAIVSMIAFHLHKPLESFDGGLACGFNWAEGARQEFPGWKGRMHGITCRKSVWDCVDWTGDAFVAIAGKLLSDCITYGKNKGCFKPAPEMQASLSSSFLRIYNLMRYRKHRHFKRCLFLPPQVFFLFSKGLIQL